MFKTFATLVLFAIALVACENNKFTQMSDSELRRQRSICRSIKHPSPGKAIACENVEREYDSRQKKKRS